MRSIPKTPFSLWVIIGLLAFFPLIRGGNRFWVIAVVSALIWALLIISKAKTVYKGALLLSWRPSDLLLLGGFVWLFAQLGEVRFNQDGFDSFLFLCAVAALFLLVRNLSQNGHALILASAFCFIAGGISLAGLVQKMGFLSSYWWDPPQFMAATFINHNHFAAYLEMFFPLGVLLLVTSSPKASLRFFLILSVLLMGLGLLLSFSRGAWLSLTLTFLFLIGGVGFKIFQTEWSSKKTALLMMFLGAVIFVLTRTAVLERLGTFLNLLSDPSIQMRLLLWLGTLGLIQTNPIVGHGLNSFVFEFPQFRPVGLYRYVDYAHNDYLQWVSEVGLIGLAVFVLISFIFSFQALNIIRLSRTTWKQGIALGGLLGLGSLVLHGLIDFPWHIPSIVLGAAALAGVVSGIPFQKDPSPVRVLKVPVFSGAFGLLKWAVIILICLGGLWPLQWIFPGAVADAWAHYGDVYLRQGSLREAVGFYEMAARKAEGRPKYHKQLAKGFIAFANTVDIRQQNIWLRKAADAYHNALFIQPRDSQSFHALGALLMRLGKLSEAQIWLGRALAADVNNPLYWKDWGELMFVKGEAKISAYAFRQAHLLARSSGFFPWIFKPIADPKVYVAKGESALWNGDDRFAQTSFEVAQYLDPKHMEGEAQMGLALLALRKGDTKKSRALMADISSPVLTSKWFAMLAQSYLENGDNKLAQELSDKSLQLDSSNVHARHVQILLAKSGQGSVLYSDCVGQLIQLNQPPVFSEKSESANPRVIWEPEKGKYASGHKTKDGWSLFTNGEIQQSLFLPPGKVRIKVTASGTTALGRGPKLIMLWNNRIIMNKEIFNDTWTDYETEIDIRPGEFLLSVHYVNDLNDRLGNQDRNLKLNKVVVSLGTA